MIHAAAFPPHARSGLLYVRGQQTAPPVLPASAVAVVGARRPSHGAAATFASHAVQTGFAVITGLALGCDTAAHRGCLAAKGVTVAVLSCGLDRVAPLSNANLAHRILNAGGFLVSKYPPGVPPRNFCFVQPKQARRPARKLIVALSRAVIVTEAQLKGGTPASRIGLRARRISPWNKTNPSPVTCLRASPRRLAEPAWPAVCIW